MRIATFSVDEVSLSKSLDVLAVNPRAAIVLPFLRERSSGNGRFTARVKCDHLGFPNPKLGYPPVTALYRLSVRQYPEFAKDFLQIPGRPEHPCPSLILPVTKVNRRFTIPCTKP